MSHPEGQAEDLGTLAAAILGAVRQGDLAHVNLLVAQHVKALVTVVTLITRRRPVTFVVTDIS